MVKYLYHANPADESFLVKWHLFSEALPDYSIWIWIPLSHTFTPPPHPIFYSSKDPLVIVYFFKYGWKYVLLHIAFMYMGD